MLVQRHIPIKKRDWWHLKPAPPKYRKNHYLYQFVYRFLLNFIQKIWISKNKIRRWWYDNVQYLWQFDTILIKNHQNVYSSIQKETKWVLVTYDSILFISWAATPHINNNNLTNSDLWKILPTEHNFQNCTQEYPI